LKLSRLIVNGHEHYSRPEEENDFLLIGARCKKTWFAEPPIFSTLQLRMLLKTRKLQVYLLFLSDRATATGTGQNSEIYVGLVGLKGAWMATGLIRVITVRELSEYLRVHPSAIYRLLRRNQIPAFRMGSDWRFNIEAIDRWRLEQDKPGG